MSNSLGAYNPTKVAKIRIKEITIGASRTVNLGNFNSIKVEGSCTVEIDADDAGMESLARAAAIEEVKTQLEVAFKEFKPK